MKAPLKEPSSMEFSLLLDPIGPGPVDAHPGRGSQSKLAELAVMLADAGVADLVMFEISPQAEPEIPEAIEQVEVPIKVSRFATTGIDDDLLPIQAGRRRFRR